MRALYRPQKVNGRPKDKALEKTTQKLEKYKPVIMNVSGNRTSKRKSKLPSFDVPL